MKRIAAVLLLVLSGCATPYMWTHPDHDDRARFDRDRDQCLYEAHAATASYSQGATARSYSGAISQGISEGIELGSRRGELGVLCMRARGYRQQALPPQ